MDFGVSFQSHIHKSWQHAMLAEQMGFTNAWFVDTQMLASDVYACMALAAEHTEKIRLGTAVTIAGTRIAPVIAHSIATVNALAPGRVILGIGTGHTAWRAMGLPPTSLATFRHTIEVCRGLLQGKEEEFITPEAIQSMSLTGTQDEIIARLKQLEAVGLTQFVISPPWGYVEESIVEFAREIMVNYGK